jgi:hypothetical protein
MEFYKEEVADGKKPFASRDNAMNYPAADRKGQDS